MSGTIVVDEAQSGNHDTSCHKSQIPFNKHVYEKKKMAKGLELQK